MYTFKWKQLDGNKMDSALIINVWILVLFSFLFIGKSLELGRLYIYTWIQKLVPKLNLQVFQPNSLVATKIKTTNYFSLMCDKFKVKRVKNRSTQRWFNIWQKNYDTCTKTNKQIKGKDKKVNELCTKASKLKNSRTFLTYYYDIIQWKFE